MNKQLLEEYTRNLEKKYHKSIIAVWVLSIFCAIFFFASIFFFFFGFEVVEQETYTYDVLQKDLGDIQNNEVLFESKNDYTGNNNALYVMIGAVLCTAIVTGGVVYGKTKNKGYKDKEKDN